MKTNSVNQSQELAVQPSESPRPAPEQGWVACPSCRGKGETMGFHCDTRCDYRASKCYTCDGFGSVTLEDIQRMEIAETIREDRVARRLTIREEGSRLGVDFAEWSRIEAGRIPETDAGRHALAIRLNELCKHEYEGFTQPGTVHGPTEYFSTCKHCGADDPGD